MVVWIGAGLVGLITVFAAVEFTRESSRTVDILAALVVTLVVIGGGSLALARVGFEWAGTTLQRALEDKKHSDEEKLPEESCGWPRFAEFCWRMELYATAAAAITLVVMVWWGAV